MPRLGAGTGVPHYGKSVPAITHECHRNAESPIGDFGDLVDDNEASTVVGDLKNGSFIRERAVHPDNGASRLDKQMSPRGTVPQAVLQVSRPDEPSACSSPLLAREYRYAP
ncbi:hypothetical protein [Amycolatopsis sp. WAC 01416]|uniref:hypothetical protein n=1 Tax=Amycolatopsis sp. WAC 01416 TaxID=2203196 RepID=UPI000F79E36F|nr:hypothetical protein [Amycolatopsis sp. WAC 01416]